MLTRVHGREAKTASTGWNVFKTLGQTAVFWTVFLVLLPMAILVLERALGRGAPRFGGPVSRWVGIALFLAGGALGLASGVIMAVQGRGTPLPSDCPRELVIAGPYRFIRNPMVVAGLAQGAAVGLILGSPMVLGYALLGGPTWTFLVQPWEEADLERRFGEPYRRYRAAVSCWLPRFPGHRPTREPSGTGDA